MLTADTGPMVIFYNKDLFDRVGVPYPKEGWTVDDLVETARKLTFKEGETQYWGYEVNGGYLRNFPWMRMNGAMEWDRIEEPKMASWSMRPASGPMPPGSSCATWPPTRGSSGWPSSGGAATSRRRTSASGAR